MQYCPGMILVMGVDVTIPQTSFFQSAAIRSVWSILVGFNRVYLVFPILARMASNSKAIHVLDVSRAAVVGGISRPHGNYRPCNNWRKNPLNLLSGTVFFFDLETPRGSTVGLSSAQQNSNPLMCHR